MRIASFVLGLVSLVLMSANPAHAQRRSIDVERFRPALDYEGFIGLNGTIMPGHGRFNTRFVINYSKDPLVVTSPDGTETSVLPHRVGGNLIAQMGIGGRGSFAIDVPLVLYQTDNAAALMDGEGPIQSNAFGDPRLTARVRVLGRPTDEERRQNDGPGVALMGSFTLPFGSARSFGGERQPTFELHAIGDFHILGLGVGLSLGWRHRFEDRFLGGSILRDTLHWAFGFKIPIPWVPGLVARAEIRGEFDARFGDAALHVIEGDLGASIRTGDVTFSAIVGTGFVAGVGAPSVRGIFAIGWAPRVNDSDSDGIPDDQDECPHLPEDFDGFDDEDGCMDPDNDNDFVPDVDDQCPDEEALEDRDDDEDGCTDPVRDADGDGIQDRDDACPERAEDMDGDADTDGCPEEDAPEEEPESEPSEETSDNGEGSSEEGEPEAPGVQEPLNPQRN